MVLGVGLITKLIYKHNNTHERGGMGESINKNGYYDLIYYGEEWTMDDRNKWIRSVIYITGRNGRTTTNLTTNGSVLYHNLYYYLYYGEVNQRNGSNLYYRMGESIIERIRSILYILAITTTTTNKYCTYSMYSSLINTYSSTY